jgi:hypothetical protein
VNRRLIREKTVCFTGHRSEKLPKGDALKHLRIKLSEEHLYIWRCLRVGPYGSGGSD